MDFHQLLNRMQELDSPASEGATEGCGMDMPPAPMAPKPDTPPPSMSVNVNAQGMDNIESMLALIAKLNPEKGANMPSMAPMPPIGMPPMPHSEPDSDEGGMPKIMSIKPINKLLPDFDGDNDDMPGGEKDMDSKGPMDLPPDHDKDHDIVKTLDKDGDKDHDMDDHDMEKKDKDEAYSNEPDEMRKGADYMNNKLAGGMNRPKDTHPKVSDGDNPMKKVKEGDDLRAQIHAELAAKLAEFMGAK